MREQQQRGEKADQAERGREREREGGRILPQAMCASPQHTTPTTLVACGYLDLNVLLLEVRDCALAEEKRVDLNLVHKWLWR